MQESYSEYVSYITQVCKLFYARKLRESQLANISFYKLH